MTDNDRRLADRLRRYEMRVPVDADAVVVRPRRVPWAPLAAVAAVLVAAVALATGLLQRPPAVGEASPTPVATPTPTATAIATAVATPLPTPSAAPTPVVTPPEPTATPRPSGAAALRWTAGTAPDGRVNAIRWIGDRWLAAGSAGDRAAVWESRDGLSWTASASIDPAPIPGPEGRGYWITDLVDYGGELVAVGWNRIGCCDGGKPIAWRSADGRAWEVLPTDGTEFEPHHFPGHLLNAPDGTLVISSHVGLGSAWITLTTRDLQTWERHEALAPEEWVSVSDVGASPTTLLAVGTEIIPGEEPEHLQRVWTSADGRTWQEVPAPSAHGQLMSVAWDETREQFIAVGSDAEDRPAAWRSSDGHTWTAGLVFDGGPGLATSIDAADGLIVASGTIGTESPEQRAWSSYDGITWQIAELPPYAGQTVAATHGGKSVISVIATSGEPEYRDVFVVWAGEP